MAFDIVTESMIDRSLEDVAAFASDPRNAPKWSNVKSVEWDAADPLRIGSTFLFFGDFLGRSICIGYQVTAFDPSAGLTMHATNGPFAMETSYAWEVVGPRRTLMRLRSRGAVKGLLRVLEPLIRPAIKRANQKDLVLLRRQLA